MPSQDKRFELEVFELFLVASGLAACPSSICQRDPPNPDIVCEVDGVWRGFELSLITDPLLEKKVRQGTRGFTYFKLDPVRTLEKKLSRIYVKDLSIDLVLHEGGTPIDHLPWGWKQKFRQILNSSAIVPFERIWVVGLEPPLVLACFYRKGSKYLLRKVVPV